MEIISPQEVTGLKLQDAYRIVTLSDGSEVSCHALLIATGLFGSTLVSAQQITGVPGSPNATVMLDGKQLPPPPMPYGLAGTLWVRRCRAGEKVRL